MNQKILRFVKIASVQGEILAEAIWNWWIGEIIGMMPLRWRGAGALIAEVSDTEFSFVKERGDERYVATNDELHGSVIIQVSPRAVLKRTLSLPLSARFRLREILANDLDRQSPIDPSKVLFTYRILSIERASARLLVSLMIVRREVVDTALARLQSAGLRIRHARIAGPQGGHEDRLSASGSTSAKMGRSNQLSIFLAALTICLVVTDACIRIAHQHTVIEDLRNEAAALHASAVQASLLRVDVEAADHRNEFLVLQRNQVSVGEILAEVTQLLPDGTWLYSLDFDGHQVQLQGYSSDASSLVARFDTSVMFSDAAFRAPMTQGPLPSLQQFDLSMNLSGRS